MRTNYESSLPGRSKPAVESTHIRGTHDVQESQSS